MDNIVHIDEKWFYLQKVNERFILLPKEEVPCRNCENKHYRGKFMFTCVVSRPIFGEEGKVLFDGKISIFPFIHEVAALVIFEAIKSCWPPGYSKDIYIQQDNAKPHVTNEDPEFRAAASSNGFNIVMVRQPAKSPDTNINDLRFFNAIQCLQQKMQTKNVDELLGAVQMAFAGLVAETLKKVFISLQKHIVEIMKRRGHNDYKIPHMGKDMLIAFGEVPRDILVDKDLVKDCIAYLMEMGHQINNAILLDSLR